MTHILIIMPALNEEQSLPETLKESNRDQAAAIGTKLATIGCDLEPWTDWDAAPIVFTADEVELLARQEHDRWWRERERAGWTLAPTKDTSRKESPYLVPWESLTQAVRDLDREPVRAIPSFLTKVGFTLVRASGSGSGGDGRLPG